MSLSTCHAPQPVSEVNPFGGSGCSTASQNVTPDGETETARMDGEVPPPLSDRPRRQLAVSNDSSAGTRSKRYSREAASTACSERGTGRSGSPEKGGGRWRRRD